MNVKMPWRFAVVGNLSLCLFSIALRARADEPTGKVEKWADVQMPVTQGLVAWFDAAKLAEARETLGVPPLDDGDALDIWPDASGAKRHVVQTQASNQPTYRPTGTFQAVRFDGLDDYLSV